MSGAEAVGGQLGGNANGGGFVKVLHCRSSVGRYGPERAVLELAPALAAMGVVTEIVALYRKPERGPAEHPWVHEARERGLEATQIHDRFPVSLRVARRLSWRVRRSGADVLHTHDYKSNMLGGLAARRADRSMPWVATVHLHTSATRRLRVYRALDLFLLRLADRVLTVSRDQRRLLLERGVDRRRIVLLPNVIDASAFAAGARPREEVRRELGVEAGEPVVTLVGRLVRQKGIDVLLDAAPRVLEAVPKARFVVAGNGSPQNGLAGRVEAAGIGDRVQFLGYRSDVASLLAASDVVTIPSRSEGLPVVLLEAMAMERPVVAAAVGGVPDLLTDGESGWLVPPDNVEALADALNGVLSDLAAARSIAAAARRRVVARCGPERAARRLDAVYRTVIAERS